MHQTKRTAEIQHEFLPNAKLHKPNSHPTDATLADSEDSMDDILCHMNLDVASQSTVSSAGKELSLEQTEVNGAMFDDDDEFDELIFSDSVGISRPSSPLQHEQLDLSTWTRCIITDIHRFATFVRLLLTKDRIAGVADDFVDSPGRCDLYGAWTATPLGVGDCVSILAVWQKTPPSSSFGYCVDMQSGFVVSQPDQLVSGTTVTGAVFCQRKSVLAERYPGVDGPNRVMFVGTFVHELFQSAIRLAGNGVTVSKQTVQRILDGMLCESHLLVSLYETRMSIAELRDEMSKFVPRIVHFMERFFGGSENARMLKGIPAVPSDKDDFDGRIERVLDIEENIWIPAMGLKGKVDVTASICRKSNNMWQNKSHAKAEIMPIELKTGKPTFSAEHRGQLNIYQMMMSATGRPVKSGLLLYLRDGAMREITATHNDHRDLILLRNQIAHYTTHKVSTLSPADATATLPAIRYLFGSKIQTTFETAPLPEPISHHSACANCAYNTICCTLLERDAAAKEQLSERHPLRRVMRDVCEHLSADHVEYFVHWSGLLALEEQHCKGENGVSSMWTLSPEQRAERNVALIDLAIVGRPIDENNTFVHVFQQAPTAADRTNFNIFQAGDYLRISSRQRCALAAGRVTSVSAASIAVRLERNLLLTNAADPSARYNLDKVESGSMMRSNLANLGRLLDNTEQSRRMRSIVIDRRPSTFDTGVPPIVATPNGRRLLDTLNAEQQTAVRRALLARDYLLLRGLPGTGKTHTISVLVVLLVLSGQRVLITSQTHSAVDTLLRRVSGMLTDVATGGGKDAATTILRLGDESRMAESIRRYSHRVQVEETCRTADDLRCRYESFRIVGVTCLGAGHPMLAQNTFDVCIVDEATQVLQTTVLQPLFVAQRFVLVGDPDQLPPIVRSKRARELGAAESLFVRLADRQRVDRVADVATDVDSVDGDDAVVAPTVSLTLQYRMNEAIARVANALVYGGDLKCGSEQVARARMQSVGLPATEFGADWIRAVLSSEANRSVMLLNTGNVFDRCREFTKELAQLPVVVNGSAALTGSDTDASKDHRLYENYCEAAVLVRLLDAIRQSTEAAFDLAAIGVIAPYTAQVDVLRRVVPAGVEVSTVDQFQGRDKDVIIMSCTKCDNPSRRRPDAEKSASRDGEVLADLRRLTVAVTRARHKLIVIGDVDSLRSYEPFRKLFAAIESDNRLQLANGVKDFSWKQILHELADNWLSGMLGDDGVVKDV